MMKRARLAWRRYFAGRRAGGELPGKADAVVHARPEHAKLTVRAERIAEMLEELRGDEERDANLRLEHASRFRVRVRRERLKLRANYLRMCGQGIEALRGEVKAERMIGGDNPALATLLARIEALAEEHQAGVRSLDAERERIAKLALARG